MDQLGGGRYRLGDQVVRRRDGGLFRAVDSRLGRDVLVQCDAGAGFPMSTSAQLLDVDDPVIARVLDGGDARAADGRTWSYLVYPLSHWVPLLRLTRPQCRRVRTIVALDTDELLVDPGWLAGRPSTGGIPVRWLPSPAELGHVQPMPARWTPLGTLPTGFREEVA